MEGERRERNEGREKWKLKKIRKEDANERRGKDCVCSRGEEEGEE